MVALFHLFLNPSFLNFPPCHNPTISVCEALLYSKVTDILKTKIVSKNSVVRISKSYNVKWKQRRQKILIFTLDNNFSGLLTLPT
jgi:hypothetical protein